ncbi:hypothetical protein ACR77J_08025 [Tissierella praeacuta]|uniref:hypothetical protein n=1 Tax=Tissierella praeacuta TaxID=43131 RepID=UPI003DA59CDA
MHMNIILNGSVFVKGQEVYFEDFEIKVEEDLSFDDFEDDFDDEDYCDEDCECCDGCEDEDELLNPLEELIEEYTELLLDECICPDCIRGILTNFAYTLIDEE